MTQRLRGAIDSGEVVEGGRLLPERELAQAMATGRRSLRHVLARLEDEGIIWRRQGKGTFVSALHPPHADHLSDVAANTSPAEVTEVRLELEPVIARFCALRATKPQLQRIREAAEHAAAADSAYAFESTDAAFHRSISQGANNSLFLAMFETLMSVLRQAEWRAFRRNAFSEARRAEVANEHDLIVQAILERDARGAETAMRTHLTSVYRHLQSPAGI
ncbi:FadR/GntR family transcriptional regulator [Roseitranquillus sediminis]|uniref:FadR/GntR family transcriptional regulator n=1 Tax=Roseitranquillus sediminis TaxID=2809051 RepID=UPI00222344D1|nr:FCD domain-containing protein [Roseitranquillus sediminis]MBM9595451.1 FadR family transcriptional regulator [Roseitranquillus sediminis]